MVNDLVPVEVDPNSAGADFWRRYHAFRRRRNEENRPDDPNWPDAIEERRVRLDHPFDIVYRYEIERDGAMLSWFTTSTVRPGAPGYDQNRHLFSASCAVDRDHRRRGVGRSWLPLALELMDRHGCTILTASSDEESGHAFLRWLGAEAKMRDAENRLRLADVDWSMVRRWIADGPLRSPHTRLEIYDGHVPESMWAEYAPQLGRLLNTIPFDQLDQGEIIVTPAHMRLHHERMDVSEEVHHTVLTREPDGTISGMTDVLRARHRPTFVEQRFTGVRPEARGRGIGKWIKAVMLDHIHRLYPEVQWISTWNADSNASMHAINDKLGFKRYRAGVEYQVTRDQLAARAGALEASS